MSDLFARVRPLVGDVLPLRRVAVMGSPAAGVLVEYLAACGVSQWVILADNDWLDRVVTQLRARFGAAHAFTVTVAALDGAIDADLAIVVDDWALACRLPVTLPRLAVSTPGDARVCYAWVALAGEQFAAQGEAVTVAAGGEQPALPVAAWDWHCAAPLVGLWARALLLHGTMFASPTWDDAMAHGVRGYAIGSADDPARARWLDRRGHPPTSPSVPTYRAPQRRRGTLMIAGLGSLGSVAALALAPWVERLLLVDPDRVEVANLARQSFRHEHVGLAKAEALANVLPDMLRGVGRMPEIVPLVTALTDEAQVAALIREYEVSALLVTTGTQADFALARAARAAAVPHVVGRCYARARYWEGVVVDGPATGSYGSRSYAEVRRGVGLGPAPAPTPEEVAAYGAVDELRGEPATALETGWAAWWFARLTAQMMLPAPLRERWLLARLAAGATCFVGGVMVEAGETGVAYGVRVPGEVHAWSAAEIGEGIGAVTIKG